MDCKHKVNMIVLLKLIKKIIRKTIEKVLQYCKDIFYFIFDSEDLTAYKIISTKISINNPKVSSIKDFILKKITNFSVTSGKNIVVLPYSFENKRIHLIASESTVIDSGFLYMKQREKGQYVISQKLDNIKARKFDDKKLILIFNQGRCGSTLISNLIRKCRITSIAECDALTQAKGNKRAIRRIIESFFSSDIFETGKIAFKLRAGSCLYVNDYLDIYPNAQYIFIKREPRGWAESYSSKFKWTAEQMQRTYLNAFSCNKILSTKSNTLLFDYDKINKWADKILSQDNLVSGLDLTHMRQTLENEFKKDSQNGYIDNTNKFFDENEVNILGIRHTSI